jgi:hypothetical protein
MMRLVTTFSPVADQGASSVSHRASIGRRVPPAAPHEHIDEKPDQQLALLGKTKKKTRRAKAAGLKSAPAV